MSEQETTWAIVELMGHVKLAGRLSEEEKFGAKMGRLDIPKPADPGCPACRGTGDIAASEVGEGQAAHTCTMCCGFVTQLFGGTSVYRITIVSEEVARHVAKGNKPQPVSPWDFPKQLQAAPRAEDDEVPFQNVGEHAPRFGDDD